MSNRKTIKGKKGKNPKKSDDTYTENLAQRIDYKNSKKKKQQFYYGVQAGHKPGVYFSWDECLEQIKGFSDAVYRKFTKKEDAIAYVDCNYCEADFQLDDDEKALLMIEKKSYIDNDRDKNLFELERLSKFENDHYIFTDGSYFKKDKAFVSRWGIYFGKYSMNISETEIDSTNNKCELSGILYALKVLDNYKSKIKEHQKENPSHRIFIVSDSKYCINSLTIWINGWQKNSWKTQKNEPVKNRELLISAHLIMNKLKLHKINYQFLHVNSHQPPPLTSPKEMFLWKGNLIADYLARYTE